MVFTFYKNACAEQRLRLLVWVGILLMALADTVGIYIQGFHLEFNNSQCWYWLSIITLLLGLSTFFRYKKWSGLLVATVGFEGLAQSMVFMSMLLVCTYIATAHTTPYCDAILMNMDRALGFNWINYITWVNKHPMIGNALAYSYSSWRFQIVIVPIVLAIRRQFSTMYGFIFAIILSSIPVVIISYFFPATGVYSYLHLNASDYSNLHLEGGYMQVEDLDRLRNGTLQVLSFTEMKGLVSFPSFHTTMAILFIWAFWGALWLRWPFFLLNVLIIAATPINGCHYLVDVIAGALIAVTVIFMVNLIIQPATKKYENTCPS